MYTIRKAVRSVFGTKRRGKKRRKYNRRRLPKVVKLTTTHLDIQEYFMTLFILVFVIIGVLLQFVAFFMPGGK